MIKDKESTRRIFDVVIIGGGFYGCLIALYFKKKYGNVIILEKESNILKRASYFNQARIHNGYHYPRSFITAQRSHKNYSKFLSDFKDAVVDDFQMVYAIANNSKTSSQQFLKLCRRLGSYLTPAPSKISRLFSKRLITDVFMVKEAVYSGIKLRKILKEKLSNFKIRVFYKSEVLKVSQMNNLIRLDLTTSKKILSKMVINCSYANINTILKNSLLPLLPLKYEFTEMPLVGLPAEIKNMGVTIIDGPFFSILPFPDRKLHTLHHVRYTPYHSTSNVREVERHIHKNSQFIYMFNDAKRYLPILNQMKHRESMFEIKTLIAETETTDARPILFKKNYHIENFHIVLGGKIDNAYDIIDLLKLNNI